MAEYPEFDKYIKGLIDLELHKYKVRVKSAYTLNKEIIDYFGTIKKMFSQLLAGDISAESVEMLEQQLKDFLPALSQLKLLTSVQCPEMMPQHKNKYAEIKEHVIEAMPIIEAKDILNQLNVLLYSNETDLKKEKDRLKSEAKKEEDRKKRANKKAEEQAQREKEEKTQKEREEKQNNAELERSILLANINHRINVKKNTRINWIIISILLTFTIFGLISGIRVIRQINRDIAALENEYRAIKSASIDALLLGYQYKFSDRNRGGVIGFKYSGYFPFFINQCSLYEFIIYERPHIINKHSDLKIICIISQSFILLMLFIFYIISTDI